MSSNRIAEEVDCDHRCAAQKMRKQIVISMLLTVICVKWIAITAVNLMTILETITTSLSKNQHSASPFLIPILLIRMGGIENRESESTHYQIFVKMSNFLTVTLSYAGLTILVCEVQALFLVVGFNKSSKIQAFYYYALSLLIGN